MHSHTIVWIQYILDTYWNKSHQASHRSSLHFLFPLYLFLKSKWEWSFWGVLEKFLFTPHYISPPPPVTLFHGNFLQDEHKGHLDSGMVVQLSRWEYLVSSVFVVNRDKSSLWHMVPLSSLNNFFGVRGMRSVFLQTPLNAGTTSSLTHVSGTIEADTWQDKFHSDVSFISSFIESHSDSFMAWQAALPLLLLDLLLRALSGSDRKEVFENCWMYYQASEQCWDFPALAFSVIYFYKWWILCWAISLFLFLLSSLFKETRKKVHSISCVLNCVILGPWKQGRKEQIAVLNWAKRWKRNLEASIVHDDALSIPGRNAHLCWQGKVPLYVAVYLFPECDWGLCFLSSWFSSVCLEEEDTPEGQLPPTPENFLGEFNSFLISFNSLCVVCALKNSSFGVLQTWIPK